MGGGGLVSWCPFPLMKIVFFIVVSYQVRNICICIDNDFSYIFFCLFEKILWQELTFRKILFIYSSMNHHSPEVFYLCMRIHLDLAKHRLFEFRNKDWLIGTKVPKEFSLMCFLFSQNIYHCSALLSYSFRINQSIYKLIDWLFHDWLIDWF